MELWQIAAGLIARGSLAMVVVVEVVEVVVVVVLRGSTCGYKP